ncbi:hypothetical protein Cabys_3268 [Caldithrix abyssi DSM 13497]|uniref:Uncharacterized protein n=1 Tax=Caldithrix abyssi DSM 13497 TaxID=880073 RepID=A0A1J1CDN7_CALAY|nr:hypothetical protein Cabys_3268 [Caldithrix abyssi DSM 13497]
MNNFLKMIERLFCYQNFHKALVVDGFDSVENRVNRFNGLRQ